MITAEKLSVYEKYDGDTDGWVLAGTDAEKATMSGDDWHQIDDLLLRLRLEKSGRSSEHFQSRTRKLLAERVQDQETVRLLRECV